MPKITHYSTPSLARSLGGPQNHRGLPSLVSVLPLAIELPDLWNSRTGVLKKCKAEEGPFSQEANSFRGKPELIKVRGNFLHSLLFISKV